MNAVERYYDDFAIGDGFTSAPYRLSEEESLAFARAYDPQPFHLDAKAAESSFFGKLVASGWQTAAITMRLIVDHGALRATGVIGTGIDELRWTAPVVPGDELRVRSEVIEKIPWPGGKRRGIVRFRIETLNQNDVVVMTQIANCIVPIRPES
jgi:acyl dehydratase